MKRKTEIVVSQDSTMMKGLDKAFEKNFEDWISDFMCCVHFLRRIAVPCLEQLSDKSQNYLSLNKTLVITEIAKSSIENSDKIEALCFPPQNGELNSKYIEKSKSKGDKK